MRFYALKLCEESARNRQKCVITTLLGRCAALLVPLIYFEEISTEESVRDEDEVLWGMYQEHLAQQRHHETQLASMTSIIMAVAGGVLAFISSKSANQDVGFLAIFLVAVGMFGALLTAKQSERAQFHRKAASAYRGKLEEAQSAFNLKSIREAVENEHKAAFPRLEPIYLYKFWVALHLLIAGLGVVMLFQ